uniref:Uncharacterized protein n=1 Tax=Romanomermis culicivorax TaxID=13658 RepID=A0A915IA49_ROMCU
MPVVSNANLLGATANDAAVDGEKSSTTCDAACEIFLPTVGPPPPPLLPLLDTFFSLRMSKI